MDHVYHTYGKEWEILDLREKKTPKRKILLHKRLYQPRGVEVEYFPTEKMWTDVMNNPKQGKF